MRWDLVKDDNEQLSFMRRLVKIRKASRALRIGDFRLLDSDKLLAFHAVDGPDRRAAAGCCQCNERDYVRCAGHTRFQDDELRDVSR